MQAIPGYRYECKYLWTGCRTIIISCGLIIYTVLTEVQSMFKIQPISGDYSAIRGPNKSFSNWDKHQIETVHPEFFKYVQN